MRSVKNRLRRMGPAFALNARWKARQTKARYRALRMDYEARAQKEGVFYDATKTAERVALRLGARGLTVRAVPRGNLRVLFAGTDEAQDTGGCLQSLEQFGQVYRFSQEDGQYGQYRRAREANGRRLLKLVEDACRGGPLHVVIGQMGGREMPWQALDAVRKMGIVTVNISMDDRHVFRKRINGELHGPAGLLPGLDLALTAAPETCLWYAVEGVPALFWPEASDPNIFHPMEVPKKYDVCFVGGSYGIRSKVVRAVERRGIEVKCFGNGWPSGRIATEEVPALFASSKIVLGVGTIGHCTDFYALKLRDFDATLSGSMYLTHANPDLSLLFEVGKEIATYRTPDECAEKCEYYLRHDRERESIARAGLARSLRDHTWEARFQQLFEVIGFLS